MDEIKPATKAQEDLLHFWELYHLRAYPADELNGIIIAIEAEQEKRYLDACRDFLERDMWVDAVTAGNTDLGYYEWCDEVIKTDGCGMLNSYDGKVSIEQVDGAEYYVIRQQ